MSFSFKPKKGSFLLPVNTENNMNKENITYRMVSNCIKQNNLKEYFHVISSHVPMCYLMHIETEDLFFFSGRGKISTAQSPLC